MFGSKPRYFIVVDWGLWDGYVYKTDVPLDLYSQYLVIDTSNYSTANLQGSMIVKMIQDNGVASFNAYKHKDSYNIMGGHMDTFMINKGVRPPVSLEYGFTSNSFVVILGKKMAAVMLYKYDPVTGADIYHFGGATMPMLKPVRKDPSLDFINRVNNSYRLQIDLGRTQDYERIKLRLQMDREGWRCMNDIQFSHMKPLQYANGAHYSKLIPRQ